MRLGWLAGALAAASIAAPAHALADKPYLAPGQFDPLVLLSPPPTSPEQLGQDLKGVLAAQAARTPALLKRASEDTTDLSAFATVLGPKFTEKNVPATAAFLHKVTKETWAQVRLAKDCWERPRPFVASHDVHPIQPPTPDAPTKNTAPHDAGSPCKPLDKPVFSYSYPSGTSNFGATVAILLAAMIPEKRDEIFARGWELGQSPLILGGHFPSDLEAGRILATATVAVMMQNPSFKTDFAASRVELRTALGLPA